MRRLHGLFLMLTVLGGCASMDSQVRSRAAHDFSCSADRVRIVDAESTVFRAAGCGSIATYLCKENLLTMRCRRAKWDTPDTQVVVTAAGRYTLTRRSALEPEQTLTR
jgi:hypothetical protein